MPRFNLLIRIANRRGNCPASGQLMQTIAAFQRGDSQVGYFSHWPMGVFSTVTHRRSIDIRPKRRRKCVTSRHEVPTLVISPTTWGRFTREGRSGPKRFGMNSAIRVSQGLVRRRLQPSFADTAAPGNSERAEPSWHEGEGRDSRPRFFTAVVERRLVLTRMSPRGGNVGGAVKAPAVSL
jgi:hypothetical protein